MLDATEAGQSGGGHDQPTFLSVVITTHDRPADVAGAVGSVLGQMDDRAGELIVVDDGSGPEAAAALDELSSAGVTVLHQDDLGLGVARATGAAAATGRWLTFLDDDDRWRPSWMAAMAPLMTEDVALVSGGARFIDPTGRVVDESRPRPLGPAFSDVTAEYLAGCFAVRRDVYDAAGGYLPGMAYSHQTELFLRLTAVCSEIGAVAAHVTEPVLDVATRGSDQRSLANPRQLFDGGRWMLARHAGQVVRDPTFVADTSGVVAVNAARLGRWHDSRRAAVRAVRDRPDRRRAWARLVIASVPPLARRVWGSSTSFRQPSVSLRYPLRHVAALCDARPEQARPSPDLLFLPWRYQENEQGSSDAHGPFWTGEATDSDDRNQVPVYRLVGRMARRLDRPTVLDVGCGNGRKLSRFVAPSAGAVVGLDQASGVSIARREHPEHRWIEVDLASTSTWTGVGASAEVVVCADVIEHVDDPYALLRGLRSLVAHDGVVVLSTPDRARIEDADPLGPPGNPRHVREWSADELELLVEAAGFRVLRRHHTLPRSYSLSRTELNRTAYRVLHRRAVPDRRYGLVLTLRVDDEVDGA